MRLRTIVYRAKFVGWWLEISASPNGFALVGGRRIKRQWFMTRRLAERARDGYL